MCESFDEFAAPEFDHLIVVPRRDLRRFSPLAGGRREVVAAEEVLLELTLQLPVSEKTWIYGAGRPVRGRNVQQMIKVWAARNAPTGAVLFIDSDTALIRPLSLSRVVEDGRVRLFRHPGGGREFAAWHRSASALLGLPERNYHGAGFVSPLVSWQRQVARSMCERIESVAGRPWLAAIARRTRFSEYTTYGVFVDHADAALKARHFFSNRSLALESWHHDLSSAAGRRRFVEAIAPHQVAVLIQSNLKLSIGETRDLVRRVRRRAESIADPATG